MIDLKRYNPVVHWAESGQFGWHESRQCSKPTVKIVESSNGQLVKYEEAKEEILSLRQEVERLKNPWISVEDELPEWGVIVLVFIPEHDGEDAYISMDCMNEDYEYWQLISENYDHAQAVGRVTDNDKMPSGVAPYTHWMPMPQQPKEQANDNNS